MRLETDRLPAPPRSAQHPPGSRQIKRTGRPLKSALLGVGVPILALLTLAPDEASAHLSVIRQGIESMGFREPNESFGGALAYGDFNGDGEDDLATGAPTESAGSLGAVGGVSVNFGSEFGLDHDGSMLLDTGAFGVFDHSGRRFGHSLAAADLDGDGFSELIVGVPGETVGSVGGAGRIYIYKFGTSGFVGWVGYGQENLGGTSEEDEHFGASLAVDDFNADSYPDIAVGAPGRGSHAGSVFVIFGVPSGPFGNVQEFNVEDFGGNHQIDDYFGASLATGQVIGDTKRDLIVGAPHRDAFNYTGAGVCYMIAGDAAGLDTANSVSFTAKVVDDVSTGASFGFALATVEDGAPYDRVIVGEPDRTIGSNSRAGRVVGVRGSWDGPNDNDRLILVQETFGTASEDYDQFGFSLSAGYYRSDTFEDLAIGTPGEDVGNVSSAGYVTVAFGGTNGLGLSGYETYDQEAVGDFNEPGDQFGTAVSLGGRFDDTDAGHLIVGVPGEDDDAGSAHVIAPWRQPFNQSHGAACVFNCEGDLIFTHKPFDRMLIASTTKIMTELMAFERAGLPPNDPDYIALDAVYTVPDWVADDIPGSTAHLVEDEQITLQNLLRVCHHNSANDAAHAVADFLYGSNGPWKSIPLFLAAMNTRAQELGMFNTHFNNANGFEQEKVGPDWGDHYSTAYDMALLSRAAMQNQLFRENASLVSFSMPRVDGSGDPFTHNIESFQTWILTHPMFDGTGIKGGWTPAAARSWCIAARGQFGDAIATAFQIPDETGNIGGQMTNLLRLGVNECGGLVEDTPWTYDYLYVREGVLSRAGLGEAFSTRPFGIADVQLELFHAGSEVEPTSAYMRVMRTSEVGLLPNETASFGVGPFQSHDNLEITNVSNRSTQIFVETPFASDFYDIEPLGSIIVPAAGGPMSQFSWTVQSLDEDPSPLHLQIDEVYGYEVFEPAVPTPEPVFSAILERSPQTQNDNVTFDIDWHVDGSSYVFVAHDPDMPADAPQSDEPPHGNGGALGIYHLPPAPNPFSEDTEIRFFLANEAEIALTIFDASGRLVRQIPTSRRTAGGSVLHWDGRTGRGTVAAPGVYFYRVAVDGVDSGGGKLTRVR